MIRLRRFLTASQIPFSLAVNFVSAFKTHSYKSRRQRWSGHVQRMGEMEIATRLLRENVEDRRPGWLRTDWLEDITRTPDQWKSDAGVQPFWVGRMEDSAYGGQDPGRGAVPYTIIIIIIIIIIIKCRRKVISSVLLLKYPACTITPQSCLSCFNM